MFVTNKKNKMQATIKKSLLETYQKANSEDISKIPVFLFVLNRFKKNPVLQSKKINNLLKNKNKTDENQTIIK